MLKSLVTVFAVPATLFWLAFSIHGSFGLPESLYNIGHGQRTGSLSCSQRNRAGVPKSMRLRGGSEINIDTMDSRLREEILLDAKRRREGKLPMFIENIGKDMSSFGSIRYADGVEAMMPPTISGDPDEEMAETAEPAVIPEQNESAQRRVEDRSALEAKEMEEAKQWFADIDKKYYTDEPEERFLGHRGMWQRRTLQGDDTLQTYFEMRQDAQIIDEFLKSIPKHLEPGSPELHQWLEDAGVHDIILRNGTRMRWRPGMQFDAESDADEDDGEWNWVPPLDKNLTWFNATLRGLVTEAWELESVEAAAVFFRGRNRTMFDLAALHTMIPDSEILDVRDELEQEAGADERRSGVVRACFDLLLAKWYEFYRGPVYREDIVAALDKAEASFRGRHGSKEAQYFSVPRPRDYYADPADD